jgi:glycosyltransferase involved in cell wall biosynthesis
MGSAVEKSAPKVLACFFVYNEADKILHGIEQMRKQTYPFVEIAVFDNCSIDGTVELIEGLTDSNVTLFKNTENQGAFKNMMRVRAYALERKDCEYFLLADMDDWYHEDYLSELVELLEKNPKAVGAIPKLTMNHTILEEKVFKSQECSFDFLENKNSNFNKAFLSLNDVSLQTCMLIRSLLRRDHIDSILCESPLFYGIDEFYAVLGIYLGGIVTTSKHLHVKEQSNAPLPERKLHSLEEAYDFSTFSKKWRTFNFNVKYTLGIKKLSLFAKVQIASLLFYRLFMKYTLVNTVEKIKGSNNLMARGIVAAYQPIKKLRTRGGINE